MIAVGYLHSDSSGILCVSEWQEAGSGIVERGENTDGEYIKFSDGTMICWGEIPAVTTHGGGPWPTLPYLCDATITLPAEFSGTDYSISGTVGDGMCPWLSYPSSGSITTTGFLIYVFNIVNGTVGAGRYIAIGRWK